jgi:hypothetical protein
MKQNIINHIALVIDRSYSMTRLASQVVEVADQQIAYLARRSKELDQETRVTVYVFDDKVECLIYDKDVLRMPSLAGQFKPGGNTALLDATVKAVDDLAKTPELYGDHAFLIYVLTDGEENCSKTRSHELESKKFGFPADNIAVWDTTSKGMTEVGEVIRQTTDNYMTRRSTGLRGSKNLFNMTVSSVTKTAVAKSLPALHFGQYRIAEVKTAGRIDEFVEAFTKRAYKLGEAFYQLSKTEKIQATKAVALRDKKTSEVYTGPAARQLLGLPDYEVKVSPTSHPDFEIFVQSASVNRKLVPGTKLLLIS